MAARTFKASIPRPIYEPPMTSDPNVRSRTLPLLLLLAGAGCRNAGNSRHVGTSRRVRFGRLVALPLALAFAGCSDEDDSIPEMTGAPAVVGELVRRAGDSIEITVPVSSDTASVQVDFSRFADASTAFDADDTDRPIGSARGNANGGTTITASHATPESESVDVTANAYGIIIVKSAPDGDGSVRLSRYSVNSDTLTYDVTHCKRYTEVKEPGHERTSCEGASRASTPYALLPAVLLTGCPSCPMHTLGLRTNLSSLRLGMVNDAEEPLYVPDSSRLVTVALTSGQRYYVVADARSPGSYAIQLSEGTPVANSRPPSDGADPELAVDTFEPDDSPADAKVLAVGETQLRTITNTEDSDWMAIDAP
jgi:hypothetical protein